MQTMFLSMKPTKIIKRQLLHTRTAKGTLEHSG